MQKKILMSMMGFGLAAFLMGSATMAWFADSATPSNVTFSSGNLDVSAGESGWATGYNKMAPNQTVTDTITVTNSGNLDMKYRLYAQVAAGTLADKLQITIKDGSTVLRGPIALSAFDPSKAIGGTMSPLDPAKVYTIEVTLPSDADNTYKNLSTGAVTFKVDATQTDNPGWGE